MAKGNIFQELAELFKTNKKKIAELWQQQLIAAGGAVIKALGEETISKKSGELLDAMTKALPSGVDLSSKEYGPITEILRELSAEMTKKNCTPSQTMTYILSLKNALLLTIQNAYADKARLNEVITLVNKLIDSLGISIFDAYIQTKEELIMAQQNALREIQDRLIQEQKRTIIETAAPVVKVWDRVLMVPLIGILDSERTQLVMDRMLSGIETTQAKVVLLDITGIPTVDTLVARHLISTASAVRLMGAECIVTGISARIAQTVVQMGIDLKGLNTRGTMADGLREAFSLLALKVTAK